jgi:hypothetical protein
MNCAKVVTGGVEYGVTSRNDGVFIFSMRHAGRHGWKQAQAISTG